MNNQERKVMYLYNIKQANYYIGNGCIPVETGINPNTNKVWYKFFKDETEEAYNMWMNKNK